MLYIFPPIYMLRKMQSSWFGPFLDVAGVATTWKPGKNCFFLQFWTLFPISSQSKTGWVWVHANSAFWFWFRPRYEQISLQTISERERCSIWKIAQLKPSDIVLWGITNNQPEYTKLKKIYKHQPITIPKQQDRSLLKLFTFLLRELKQKRDWKLRTKTVWVLDCLILRLWEPARRYVYTTLLFKNI